jgi:excisionase family DNA binding protein
MIERMNIMENMRSNWLTIPEAAVYLHCGERFLRELVASLQIPHVNLAGKALFHPNRLDAWLFEQEITASAMKSIGSDKRIIPEDLRRIRIDCPRNQVENLITELLNYKKGKERWVNGLGRNLRKDLDKQKYIILSEPVYSQLSRWCHVRKTSARNNWTQERARNISMLLYGKVIDRAELPSYRS